MFHYPWYYRLYDWMFDLLFFGILKENPKKNESRFVRFAAVIQLLKMIAIAGVLAAASCIFVPQEVAVVIWIVASLILMIFGITAFGAYCG